MTKEELKKEAKSYAKRKFDEEEQAYLHDIIAQTYLAGAEPREKRIEELENKIADIKANCDLAIEGRDIKIKELELELTVEKDQHQEEINLHLHAEDYIDELEQQIEKMKCCYNCKSFKGYGETCEGWGEPVLNPNCDCTEWELRR